MKVQTLEQRIRDRLSTDWLTPSQRAVWERIQQFDGAPHHVINVYGARGSGKSFLGWLLQREGHATYSKWAERPKPTLPRLILDNAATDRASSRAIRPLITELSIKQIILLSRQKVDEPDMPAFPLQVTAEDMEHFRANLFRYLSIIIPEETDYLDYRRALEAYYREES